MLSSTQAGPDAVLGRTIWGVLGLGAFGFQLKEVPAGKHIITTTRSHNSKLVTDCIAAMNPDNVLRVGGAGNKVQGHVPLALKYTVTEQNTSSKMVSLFSPVFTDTSKAVKHKTQPGVVLHTEFQTGELEDRRIRSLGYPCLEIKFEASLGYRSLCLK